MKWQCLTCSFVALALLGQFQPVRAGGDKVFQVGKDGLKITGKIGDDEPKVKFVPFADKEAELPGKTFQVKVTAGTKYRVTMNSDDLDSVLVVKDNTGKQIAWDDDSGGDLNSLLTFEAAKDATYKIYALSLKGTGSFTLQVKDVGGGAKKVAVHEVGAGLTIKGKLGNVKSISYNVKLLAGKTYQIDMISADQMALDPYMRLFDPAGKKLAEDDDGGDGLNSQITFNVETTGTYRIEAAHFGGAGNGDFTLIVVEKK